MGGVDLTGIYRQCSFKVSSRYFMLKHCTLKTYKSLYFRTLKTFKNLHFDFRKPIKNLYLGRGALEGLSFVRFISRSILVYL